MSDQGWRADPTGRHELRYFDGAWTPHVSDHGRPSADPDGAAQLAAHGAVLPPPAPRGTPISSMPGWQQGPWPTSQPLTNGLAIAALVVGIVGACFGLIPLSFFLALPLGILGLIFGIVSWRKARRGAPRKGMAISGVVLGAVAITLGVIGAVIVNNAVDDLKDTFDDLGPADEGDFEVSLTSCGPNDSGYGEATGVIENTSNREQNFWITIYFVQNGTRVGQADDYIQDLGSGDSAQFEARGFDEVADSAECEVNVE